MDAFPLTPFLASLSSDGIRVMLDDYDRIGVALRAEGPWTIGQVRDVLAALLVQSPDQEDAFLRRFGEFFDLALDTSAVDRAIDAEAVRRELSTLLEPPRADRPPEDTERTAIEPPRREAQWWARTRVDVRRTTVLAAILLAVELAALGGVALYWRLTPPQPAEVTIPPDESTTTTETTTTTVPEPKETVTVTPDGKPTPVALDRTFEDAAGVAGVVVFAAFLAWAVYSATRKRDEEGEPPRWSKDGPRLFPTGSIGGRVPPRLDNATLDAVADSLGYFRSESVSRVLDVRASIQATSRNGGMPVTVFRRRKQLRSVVVLEDERAEPLAWNPAPREIAEGLTRRGVSLLYGRFSGSPERFWTADGAVYQLEDLDAERASILLLVFSDAKGLRRHRDRITLERLANWPMVAWMELREPRFWDRSTALVAGYGIPVYPATPEGLARATARFVTESGPRADDATAALRNDPPSAVADSEAHVEHLLGDALRWAQACAMIQPVSPGLADALRRAFLPHLPPERVERLHRLPGTTRTVAGLRFSTPVLATLRAGFAIYWDDAEQEAVLAFILARIRDVEPPETDSLAHLAWEWSIERVRLELDPDRAVERIAELAKTPLGNAIRANLDDVVLPGQTVDGDWLAVPLRVAPKTHAGQVKLAALAERIEPPDSPARQFMGFRELLRGTLQNSIRFADLKREWDEANRQVEEGWARLVALFSRLARRDPGIQIGVGLHVRPAKLVVRASKRVGRVTRRLVVRRASGASGGIYVAPDVPWLQVDPKRLDADESFWRLRVTADTSDLAAREYRGNLVYYGTAGEASTPVELTVYPSARERAAAWLGRNRAAVMRVALATLSVVTVFGLWQVLPPNWMNRLHNTPPSVTDVVASNYSPLMSDSGEVIGESWYLDATANDEDGDGQSLKYTWSGKDGARVADRDGATAAQRTDSRGTLLVDRPLPEAVTVTVRVEDESGGVSIYDARFAVASVPVEAPATSPVDTEKQTGTKTDTKPPPRPPPSQTGIVVRAVGATFIVELSGGQTTSQTRTRVDSFVLADRRSRTLLVDAGSYTLTATADSGTPFGQVVNVQPGRLTSITLNPPPTPSAEYGLSVDVDTGERVAVTVKPIDDDQTAGSGEIWHRDPSGRLDKPFTTDLFDGQYEVSISFSGAVVGGTAVTLDAAKSVTIPVTLPLAYYQSTLFGFLKSQDTASGRQLLAEALRKYPNDKDLLSIESQMRPEDTLVPAKPIEQVRMASVGTGSFRPDRVTVTVTIDQKGTVTDASAHPTRTTTNPVLEAAEDAARRWRFEPAQRGGVAVESTLDIEVLCCAEAAAPR